MQHEPILATDLPTAPAADGDAFGAMIGMNLQPLAIMLLLLFLLLALLEPLIVPPGQRLSVALLTLSTALIYCGAALALRLRAPAPARVDGVGTLLCLVALGHSIGLLALLRDPHHSINLALTVIGAGCHVLSRRRFALICLGAVAGYGAMMLVAVRADTVAGWAQFGLLLAEATTLALAILIIRRRLFRRVWLLRVQDRQRSAELEAAMLEAKESEMRVQSLLDAAFEGIAIHQHGRFIDMNEAFAAMFGYTRAELLHGRLLDLVAPADHPLVLERVKDPNPAPYLAHGLRRDGSIFPGEVSGRTVPYRGQLVRASVVRDITRQRETEATITRMAYYDALTALPNRRLFGDTVQQALLEAEQSRTMVGVVFLDLDRFKVINDTLGHGVGDALLRAVADRLRECLRTRDTVARMGGDEFTIVLPELAGRDVAAAVAERIYAALAAPLRIDSHDLVVRASIGVALYPADGADVETLLKHADTAMYRAKLDPAGPIQFYTPTMRAAALQQLELEQQLRRALERREFCLMYQPRVTVADGVLSGMEALVRWEHPERGAISPADFIPVAEQTGLIIPLGAWVLETACAQARAWRAAGYRDLRVAVNLSARQFQQADLAQQIKRTLAKTGLEPYALELEITESTAMHDVEATLAIFGELKAMGVELSIDDFGTGYSSLSYLKRFKLDRLKLDQSFVSGVTTNAQDASIASGVIALAHSLGIAVTAEGVETEAQRAFLVAHGCDELQGYLLSKPLTPDAFAAALADAAQRGVFTARLDPGAVGMLDSQPEHTIVAF